ncbi:flagellar biosynthesis anti-sigma factor FlgM [Rossellomorea aquimaris]|uniref:Negative regulator of flagellin synthesis n=1 Tax=Rossellomorea aquimaris TaxID=189382 RepID=A0A5D4TED1_9BACI|nr:flagellar biosynthesis anti-sigma factor FlgM [Rossellomorea aquimaris]TYS73987.1 flagellar biosynthesis anti-sigma factor FlgM [Rossellomorea aquimaris]
MKINNINNSGINPYKRQLSKLDQAAKTNPQKADKIEISSAAKEMQETSKLVQERKVKVEELKVNVENGTYKPDPQKIAKGLINFYRN